MPKEGSMIKFKHHNRKMRVPFVVFADFEALVKPIGAMNHRVERVLPIPIKNINHVDFVITSNVLTMIRILKNQSFTGQRVTRRI